MLFIIAVVVINKKEQRASTRRDVHGEGAGLALPRLVWEGTG